MSEGYTYTTLSAHQGKRVKVAVSFYLDEHASITVFGIKTGRPHLSVSHGDVSVSFAPACADQATEQDARLARTLADEAATYAAEVERLAAAGDPGDAAA
jgi:hypothetical protein